MIPVFVGYELESTLNEMIRQIGEMEPTPVGAMFGFKLHSCDAERGEYVFECSSQPWMRNTAGFLHGGMSAAILDQAMSFIARARKPEKSRTSTVELQVYHHRPITTEEKLTVKINEISRTQSFIHFRGEIYCLNKLCLSGNGMFFNKKDS